MTADETAARLSTEGVTSHRLEGPAGCALVGLAGARVFGIWPERNGPNILWTNPESPKPGGRGDWDNFHEGGLGGDRTWFGPEYRYFWDGPPIEHRYRVPAQADAGNYRWTGRTAESAAVAQDGALADGTTGESVEFSYERRFSLAEPPHEAPAGLAFFGLRISQLLSLRRPRPSAELDAWNIAQAPAGAWMLVPTRGRPEPIARKPKVGGRRWVAGKDHLRWHIGGDSSSKIGLEVLAVTGRMGYVLRRNGRLMLFVKSFSPMPGLPYRDGGESWNGSSQCVQIFDGGGYGELEFHTPTAVAKDPEVADTQFIWCFSGEAAAVRAAAEGIMDRRFPDEVFA